MLYVVQRQDAYVKSLWFDETHPLTKERAFKHVEKELPSSPYRWRIVEVVATW